MSEEFWITSVLPVKVLCQHVILHERAMKEDLQFIKSISKSDETPDKNRHNAINTKKVQSLNSKTSVILILLLHRTKSDPSTVLIKWSRLRKLTIKLVKI